MYAISNVKKTSEPKTLGEISLPTWTKELFKQIETIKFGSVTLIVQDGAVVQIDKVEKVRLIKNKNSDL